jgi:hypothetical protein
MISLFALATAAVCGAPPGAEELWKSRGIRILMLGEVHGTNEIPELAGTLLCESSKQGRLAALALEAAPDDGQAALDRYLASKGTAADLAELRRAPMWLDRYGRGSEAVLKLVERARKLGARVFLFDAVRPKTGPTDDSREQAMADRLVAAAEHGRVIALTGMGHADRHGFVSLKPAVRSAAQRLPHALLLTLAPAGFSGEVWGCRVPSGQAQRCGIQPVRPRGEVSPGSIRLVRGKRSDFDALYSVGQPFTSSPPAGRVMEP